jgi:hypothetical protein
LRLDGRNAALEEIKPEQQALPEPITDIAWRFDPELRGLPADRRQEARQ